MPYADIADVQGHLPQRRFDTQTTPTVEEVLRYCELRSGELDGYLADKGISLPLDQSVSPRAWAWCRAAVACGAAADAESAGFPGQAGTAGGRSDSPRVSYLARRWDAMIAALVGGAITLTDAPRAEGAAAGRGTRGPGADGAAAAPWFGREQTWDHPFEPGQTRRMPGV
jgi:hypothetical protein